MHPLILIPARISSTRLPRKALADIGGKPMIARVVERISPLGLPFAVATDNAEIKAAVEAEGARAVMTPPECPSGSDRIFHALQTIDAANTYDVIVNVQGDMPLLDAGIIPTALDVLASGYDIATLAAAITEEAELNDPAVVKVVISGSKAIYFSRAAIPYGANAHFHHIGIYAYTRSSLERFVKLPPSQLEQQEKLEQLRALEAGMTIGVGVVDTVPFGVDTPEGLQRVRAAYAHHRH